MKKETKEIFIKQSNNLCYLLSDYLLDLPRVIQLIISYDSILGMSDGASIKETVVGDLKKLIKQLEDNEQYVRVPLKNLQGADQHIQKKLKSGSEHIEESPQIMQNYIDYVEDLLKDRKVILKGDKIIF